MDDDVNVELIRLVNEDLAKHREYLHRLYTRVFVAGAVMISLALVAGVWLTAERLNSQLVKQLLDSKVSERVDALAKTHVEVAMKAVENRLFGEAYYLMNTKAMFSLEDHFMQDFSYAIDEKVMKALEGISNGISLVPEYTVVSVTTNTCPSGWVVFDKDAGYVQDKRLPTKEEKEQLIAMSQGAGLNTESANDSVNQPNGLNDNTEKPLLVQCMRIY